MGLAGLFLFGFVGYCCYQVRGAARGRAEVEDEVDLEVQHVCHYFLCVCCVCLRIFPYEYCTY